MVVSKNKGRTIWKTLSSIIRADIPEGYDREIIVVDARSRDLTPYILRRFRKWIRVIYDEGKGVGIARNIGVLSSRGDIICFIDADAIVSKKHFIEIVDMIKKGYDIVGVQESPPVDIVGKWSKVAKLELLLWRYGRVRKLKGRNMVGGVFLSYKRSVFYDIGGYWTYPPFGFEDLDFTYRASKKGFKIALVKSLGSYSIPRQTLKDLFKEQVEWGCGGAFFAAKYRRDPEFIKAYRFKGFTMRNPVIYFPLRLLFAFIGSISLFISTKTISIIPYWIARRFVFLIGYMKCLKKALSYYSR